MIPRVRTGVIGAGAISGQYLRTASSFPILDVCAIADLEPERAAARAAEFGIACAPSPDELLADPEIELVLNLTVPKVHAEVALACLSAGKHTYHEKPFAVSRDEGRAILDEAAARNLRVGCAPDTFLGAGLQTARAVLDSGRLGRPVAFSAQMLSPGVETWHPNPPFYYEPGGGPMLDMGPYYLTALLNLLGPVASVQGAAAIAIPTRRVTSRPLEGLEIRVTTPDHVCGLLTFAGGAVGTLMTSFAVTHGDYDRKHPIVVYGTEGAMRVPDPNHFDGTVEIRLREDPEWRPVVAGFPAGYGRAVGLADMAAALRSGRPHRCSAAQAFAVLDLMQGCLESAESGAAYPPGIEYQRPEPLREGAPFGAFD